MIESTYSIVSTDLDSKIKDLEKRLKQIEDLLHTLLQQDKKKEVSDDDVLYETLFYDYYNFCV